MLAHGHPGQAAHLFARTEPNLDILLGSTGGRSDAKLRIPEIIWHTKPEEEIRRRLIKMIFELRPSPPVPNRGLEDCFQAINLHDPQTPRQVANCL